VLLDRRCLVPSLSSGWWLLFGCAKPLGLDICHGVDHLGTCETESYMDKLIFTRASYPMLELSRQLCVYPW
jgi:hypothetical protein